ncbi:putative xyloglucan endotransglucosylase/hydrolase protein 30 [Hibiscus syriacus]|uniref:Xyloglucan endotransglucosylase/hydrolase protein 30 n=1 Tax=Hibiscus syriacus TaxID=106335 RepID=A0A6A2X5B5_HIBSY|nr:putative xyloglucan endotransglucosylase/hydrolase protein 30 [Hibiscus syriacus]
MRSFFLHNEIKRINGISRQLERWQSRNNSAGFDLTAISFGEGYNPLFGDFNLVRSPDGNSVRLLLDVYSGSGFISSNMYAQGLFSAKIKLPSDDTAGVVVAFYASNGDVFEIEHDELDIEFLGNVQGQPWRFQTNLEVIHSDEMGGDYPSKPMSLYATIWDASSWATGGGKIKVNYDYAPFTAEFRELVLEGCPMDPIQEYPDFTICKDKDAWVKSRSYAFLTPASRHAEVQAALYVLLVLLRCMALPHETSRLCN